MEKEKVISMTDNVKQVLHTGISVYNMEESLKWYKENLGFEVVKNDGYCPPLKAKAKTAQSASAAVSAAARSSRFIRPLL